MKCSVIFILLGLLALTQAEDDETMALVRSCKTIQDCHVDEFLNCFFRPMSVVADSHLYLTCLKKKGQMTNDRRVTLSNINCLKKAISAH